MKEYFKDKSAIVTGAASGFGLGITKRLLEYGASEVWMYDVNMQLLEEEAGKLQELYPGKVFYAYVKPTEEEQVKKMVRDAAEHAGRLDFLFNNAGKPMTCKSETIESEDFNLIAQLNYSAVAYATFEALKYMSAQKSGHVVNTASLGGLIPIPFQAVYVSTKAAVISFTRCLRYEYEGTGIYFSQVSPSNVATPIFTASAVDQMRKEGLSEEEIKERLKDFKAPPEAMSLDEALDSMFRGIENKETDILLDESSREFYKHFRMDTPEFRAEIAKIAKRRREYYEKVEEAEAKGLPPESIPFPG